MGGLTRLIAEAVGYIPEQLELGDLIQHVQTMECLFLIDNCTEDTPMLLLQDFVTLVKSTYKPKFLVTSRELLDFDSTDGIDMRQVFVGALPAKDAARLVEGLYPELMSENLGRVIDLMNWSRMHPQRLRKVVVKERRAHMINFRRQIATSSNTIQDCRSRRRSLTRVCQQAP